MVEKIGVQGYNSALKRMTFGKSEEPKKSECENKDTIVLGASPVKITGNKLVNAFTKYPVKGLKGSKNANFYEFLTMGVVPYLAGSAALMGVFNLARAFFNTADAVPAAKLGNKMALGVALYGIAKTASKKLIENPVKRKFGIDVNMPYKKVIYELPEDGNENDLVSHEYHKVYESVDFPRWDLLYNNPDFGEERNSYFDKIAKKMKIDKKGLEQSDQKVKPAIKEKLIQTKVFSTLSSYLWAATAVGVAMQSPWESFTLKGERERLKQIPDAMKRAFPKGSFSKIKEAGKVLSEKDGFSKIKEAGKIVSEEGFSKIKEAGRVLSDKITFVKSCKYFVNGTVEKGTDINNIKRNKIAGLALLGAAIGMTMLGNFITLKNVNKNRGAENGASPLIDKDREKVVC
ncbi:hypothetical protein II906_10685 [bacterium]|nr:hypothetical protein [bacterium]